MVGSEFASSGNLQENNLRPLVRTDEVPPIRSSFGRIKRLHPFTWLVTLAAFAALVLVMVPAEEKLPGAWREMTDAERRLCEDVDPIQWVAPAGNEQIKGLYTHGWPWVCVARGTYDASIPSWTISSRWPPKASSKLPNWLQGDNWPRQVDVCSVDWRLVALNTVVAVLLLIATVIATECWIRRRGGLFKIRLADLLMTLTICAIVMGYYGYHLRLTRIEESVGRHFGIHREGGSDRFSWSNTYQGPELLTRLVGYASLPSAFYHHDVVRLSLDDAWASDIEQLVRLGCVNQLHIQTTCPRSAVQQLATLPRLEELQLPSFWKHEVATGEMTWAVAGDTLFRPQDLYLLGRLQIERLGVQGDAILAEDVEQLLAASSTLKSVELADITATDEQVEALRNEFPQVAISCSWQSYKGFGSTVSSTSPHDNAAVDLVRKQREESTALWQYPGLWVPSQ